MEYIFNLEDDSIESVCLFGSTARGDNDSISDIDIFILIDDCDEQVFIEKKIKIIDQLNIPSEWVSLYRKSTIKDMHKYGSYFLWHIKLEGIILYSRSGFLESIFKNLPRYRKVEEDLKEYLAICQDIKKSIQKDTSTLHYELSVLASLVRNTCIAIAFLHNRISFGRVSVVEVCKNIMGMEFPFSVEEYEELYKFRIAYNRSKVIKLQEINVLFINKWIERVESLINYALKYKKEGCKC